MQSTEWEQLIRQVYERGHPVVLVLTGGGASAISRLLTVPGASRSILEAHVPYAPSTLREWLGREPEQYCSERTALAMASVACQRATKIVSQETTTFVPPPIGISCTAALVSDRPKRGAHRCYIGIQSTRATIQYSLVLDKNARNRVAEDELVGMLILKGLAQASGIERVPAIPFRPADVLQTEEVFADPLITQVWQEQTDCVWSLPGGKLQQQIESPPAALLCGAFDPLHAGHLQLRDVARDFLKCSVGFEISITNVDKPPLDFLTIERRRHQFTDAPLALTNAPRFAQKVKAFAHTTFIVGSDTAERIVSAKYYGDSIEGVTSALQRIAQSSCQFLVAARMVRGQLLTLKQIAVPQEFQHLFRELPEDLFRADISSSEIRQQSVAE